MWLIFHALRSTTTWAPYRGRKSLARTDSASVLYLRQGQTQNCILIILATSYQQRPSLGLEKVDFQLVLSLRASSPPLGEGAEQETGLQQTPTSSAPLNDAEITRSSFEKHDSLHGDSTTHLPFHVFIALPSGCTSSYHHNHIFVRYSHASISWFIAAGT